MIAIEGYLVNVQKYFFCFNDGIMVINLEMYEDIDINIVEINAKNKLSRTIVILNNFPTLLL